MRLIFMLFMTSVLVAQTEKEVFKISDLVRDNLFSEITVLDEVDLVDPDSGSVSIRFLRNVAYGIERPVFSEGYLFSGFYKKENSDGHIVEVKLMLAGMECMKATYFPSGSIKSLMYFNNAAIRDAMNFKMASFNTLVNNYQLVNVSAFSNEVQKNLHLALISERTNPKIFKVLKFIEDGTLDLKADVSVDYSFYDKKELNQGILSRYKVSSLNISNYELIREDTMYTFDEKSFKKMLKYLLSKKVILPKNISIKDCVFTGSYFYHLKDGQFIPFQLSEQLKWYRSHVRSYATQCPDNGNERKRLTGVDETYYLAKKEFEKLNFGDFLKIHATFPQSNGDYLLLGFDGKGRLNGSAELFNEKDRLKMKGSYLNGWKTGTWSLYDDQYDVKKGIAVFHEDTMNYSQGSVYETDFSSLNVSQRSINKMNKTKLEECYAANCSEEKYLTMLLTVFR